jgi:deferrochelatase/peroxidase EfeB
VQADARRVTGQIAAGVKSALAGIQAADGYRAGGYAAPVFTSLMLTTLGYAALGHNGMAPPELPARPIPGGGQPWVDALLIVAFGGRDPAEYDMLASAAVAEAHGASIVRVEWGAVRFNDDGKSIEPFGYVDGISQPYYLQEDVPPAARINLFPGAPPAALLHSLLVADPAGMSPVPAGSVLAFQKIYQDREAFELIATLIGWANAGRPAAAGAGDIARWGEAGGAAIIGRFRDGTPLQLAGRPLGTPSNNFVYPAPPNPATHISAANPRAGAPPPRFPRRGMPFGARPSGAYGGYRAGPAQDDREGLLFMSYHANEADFAAVEAAVTAANGAHLAQALAEVAAVRAGASPQFEVHIDARLRAIRRRVLARDIKHIVYGLRPDLADGVPELKALLDPATGLPLRGVANFHAEANNYRAIVALFRPILPSVNNALAEVLALSQEVPATWEAFLLPLFIQPEPAEFFFAPSLSGLKNLC